QKPDLLIIVDNGNGGIPVEGAGLNTEVMKVDNIGPAASFSLGARRAHSLGYDYFIFADDDAVPVRKDVIERMRNHKAPAVAGHYHNGVPITLANHYFMISRETAVKTGLYFVPFFMMCEDMEYFQRVEKAVSVVHDKEIVIERSEEHTSALQSHSDLVC